MSKETTTVEVATDTWSGLNQLKRPGDSFNEVIGRLLELAGATPEQPPDDESHVAGDVVLARTNKDDQTVLVPSLKIRDRKADEAGDYDVVHLSKLKWGSDSSRPRARGYLDIEDKTLSYNDNKIVELDEAPTLVDLQNVKEK